MDNSEIRKKSSSSRRKFKFEFMMIVLVAVLAVLIDRSFGQFFLRTSVDVSGLLQRLPLRLASKFFSVVVFGALFLTAFVLFMVQKHIEKNLVMMLGVFLLIYFQAVLKLAFADGRPIFFAPNLPYERCICDYGKPSGHALCTAGLLLFIYSNFETNYQMSRLTRGMLKTLFWFIFVAVCLSRMYLAAHSYNQVILGGIFGLLIFIVLGNFEESILKLVIIPLILKDKLKERKAIYDLIALAVATNYLMLYLWSYRRNYFEHMDNEFYSFLNCFECLFEGRAQFSNKIISDALNFNALFGILFGAYLFPGKGTYWVGFGTDGKWTHTLARVCMLVLFLVPLTMAGAIRTSNLFVEVFKNITCSVLTGFLLSNTLAKFSIWITAPKVADLEAALPLRQ